MRHLYLTNLALFAGFGTVASIGIWGEAAHGGDHLIAARFLTVIAIIGIGHCFYKLFLEKLQRYYS